MSTRVRGAGPDELLLVEAATQLDTNPAKVYQMGARGELSMRYDPRFGKWMVTAESVRKYQREHAARNNG